MMETPVVHNPYVGPRTFEEAEADRFFGREREARELVALVVSERLALFYAQSGAGKSSLINARLVPRLRDEEGFAVLPVGRVSGVLPDGVDPATIDNIFVYHLILGLSQKLAEGEAGSADDHRAGPPDLQHTSLTRFLSGESGPDPVTETDLTNANPVATESTKDLMPHVLIIDQFEELLTTYPERWQERVGFFEQLNTAMARHPNLWVVLTLREDYVAGLEPFSHLTPNRLRARFYMQRMGIEAAREAIERPAANAGRPFAGGVAGRLVDNLRMVRTAGQNEYHAGEYVEPVQLQVVCFQLWQDLHDRPAPTIQLADLERLAGGGRLAEYVDRALSDFYEKAITKVVETAEVDITERALRKWFSDELITEAGTRSIVFRNETTGKTEGLPNQAVDLLAAQFLLRTELRAGGAWVELVHDRLVEPIRDSNLAWLKQNQSPLQRQAAIWRDEGKPPDRLLLTADDLTAAERWAAAHEGELEPHEVEFLGVSKAAQDALDRELVAQREAARQRELESAQALAEEQRRRADEQARAANRLRAVATAAVAFALLAIIAMAYARVKEQARATAAQAAATAAAAEAIALSRAERSAQAAAVAATAQAIAQEAMSTQLAAQAERISQEGSLDLALLLGAEALRAGDTPGARQILADLLRSRPEVRTYLRAHHAAVRSLALSQDGGRLISSDDTGRLVLWQEMASDMPAGAPIESSPGAIQAVAVAWDGTRWAAGSAAGLVQVWEETEGPSRPLGSHAAGITGLAFSPDSRFLASASFDGSLMLWPLAPEGAGILLEPTAGPVTALAFSPATTTGPLLATGGDMGQVIIWREPEVQQRVAERLPIPETISATVASLAFNAAGTQLAIGFEDGQVIVWDMAGNRPVFEAVDAGDISVEGLAFDPRGDSLMILFTDGSLNRSPFSTLISGSLDPRGWTSQMSEPTSGTLAQDGQRWVIGLNTGAIMLANASERAPVDDDAHSDVFVAQVCHIANRNLHRYEWDLFMEGVPYRKTCPALEEAPLMENGAKRGNR